MADLGYIEGEICNRHGCNGIMAERPIENCSCHISPPCGSCTEERGYCTKCGADVRDEREQSINDYVCNVDSRSGKIWEYKLRVLDKTKIDWYTKSHTHFTQICEGVYPEGTSSEEVRKLVDGTFGGRFESFGGGKFKFIAYTD
jgi:hypothetical protein